MDDLAVVVVNFNTIELTSLCLKSIFEKKWKINFKVWVVDNNSSDNSVIEIKKHFPQVGLIESKINLGFAGGNNLALKKVKARYVILLNSDTEVFEGSLDSIVDFMDRSGFGISSCKLIDKEGKLQPNAGDLPFGFSLLSWLGGLDDLLIGVRQYLPSFHRQFINYYHGEKEVGWVSGSVMVIRREVLSKIGLLDDMIFMYAEDTEYCIRAKKAGFKIGWTNEAKIKHLGGGSSPDPALKQWIGEFKGLLYIYKKYYGFLGELSLRLLIYFFIMIRMMAFFVTGKFKVSKTYGKVIANI